ncbi:MAG: sigma-54-dependent Fis family transcriptional regulator [Paludibacteraceae bacterium]|nr:sigma-54-dependent Fis family transcriptional regulator [Paludibacteraceae bacterium]
MITASELTNIKQKFGIIGQSPELNRAIETAMQVANTDLSVLVIGESGVGKENIPKIIHYCSARRHATYIATNCGGIPEGTVNSELFGHEKGAYSGAIADRKGYFEVADGGTIFLDEVGELPMSTQAMLLRILETGEYMKMGSSTVSKTNVRVIAATNVDLPKAIREGRFREDLYYRLNAVTITLPALRNRQQDILPLFTKFSADCAERYKRPVIRPSEEAKAMLTKYYWRGNIRQLKNVAEQISVLENETELTADTLRKYLPNEDMSMLPTAPQTHERTMDDMATEREFLYKLLYEMRNEMNDLKSQIDKMRNDANTPVNHISKYPDHDWKTVEVDDTAHTVPTEDTPHAKVDYAVEAEEVGSSLSYEEKKIELAHKALEKHKGNRKLAAAELQISERSLYRLIQKYGLK